MIPQAKKSGLSGKAYETVPVERPIDGAVKRSKTSKSDWVRNCLLTAARSATV
jgi:hypothetical protein